MTKIVGIIGLAGAGKDTFAGYLRHMLEWYGMGTETHSFAWAVREITAKTHLPIYDRTQKELGKSLPRGWQDSFHEAIDTVLGDHLDGQTRIDLYVHTVLALRDRGHIDKDGNLYCSPREFAQLLGTEGGRSIHEDFWVDILLSRIKKEAPDVALVPDTRFVNEALKCDSLVIIRNPRVRLVNNHPSEELAARYSQRGGFEHALLHKSKFTVDNDGSLAALKQMAAYVSCSMEVK